MNSLYGNSCWNSSHHGRHRMHALFVSQGIISLQQLAEVARREGYRSPMFYSL